MRTEPSFSADSDDHLLDANGSRIPDAASDPEAQLLSDYRQRYGLSVDPFADDPHFPFYPGAQRRQVLEQLLHLCQFSNNLLLVTGEYGVGKTRMAQALIDCLDDADDISFVEGQITTDINFLLSEVFSQFELTTKEEFAEFCRKKSEQDGLVVLIVDNAHHLTDAVIEDLINLLQENYESRLHLVLFAEPHLVDRLGNVDAPDIVLTDFFLEKLSLAEAIDYLNFRMEMADYLGPEIFIEAKVEPWWRESQGQLLLLHERAQEKLLQSVTPARPGKFQRSNSLVPHIVATSVLVGGLFVGYLYLGENPEEKSESNITISASVATQSESFVLSSTSSSVPPDPISAPIAAEPIATPSNQEQSNTPAASTAAALSSPSVTSDKADQAIKQSVVPLAQTNELQAKPIEKRINPSSVGLAETKKPEVSSAPKSSSKAKSENNLSRDTKDFSTQEKMILSWDASGYTLQIVGLSSEKAALEFIATQSNKKDLLLFKSLRKGKDWFVVVTGNFSSSVEARQAAKALPASQLKAAPWPRDLQTVQREIRE
jgi:DamX protein